MIRLRAFFLLLILCLAGCKPEVAPDAEAAPLSGREIYNARCITCHQADGGGVPGICPPLATSPRLTGPPEDLIRIMLLGMKGQIVRNGETYSGVMPSWRFDLNDTQIAALLNDLHARWNSSASPVTEEMVARIRGETLSEKLFPSETGLKLLEGRPPCRP